MKTKLWVVITVAASIAGGAAAHADDFYFTFQGDPANGPGAVSGEIFGLQDNTTSSALRVAVTANSASLPAPIIFNGDDPFTLTNLVGETNGHITAANFSAIAFDPIFSDLQLNFEGFNSLEASGLTIQNEAGLAGATFTRAVAISAAPEPSVWVLLLMGVGALGVFLRRACRSSEMIVESRRHP